MITTSSSLAWNQPCANAPMCSASARPSTQATIIDGFMIALSRRRSMTLKVSAGSPVAFACAW